jgi:nucleolar protein 56
LYESSSGYALFERLESEEIGSKLSDVAAAASDLTKFGKMVKLKSFAPFKSAAHALENMNDVSEGSNCDNHKKKHVYAEKSCFLCLILTVPVFLC